MSNDTENRENSEMTNVVKMNCANHDVMTNVTRTRCANNDEMTDVVITISRRVVE